MDMGYSQKYWCCPYFKWDERLCIHCECGKIGFPDLETRKGFVDAHCASLSGWQNCSMAAARNDFYRRKDEEHEKR